MRATSAAPAASVPRAVPWAPLLGAPCGALAAAALPPVDFTPGLLGFGLLLVILERVRTRRAAFLTGLAFGYVYFLLGLYWVAIAFYIDVEQFGALAVPAVLLLALGCALFPALTAWLLRLRPWRTTTAAAVTFALLWTATEALRGDLLVGFPWNMVAVVWAPYDAMLQPLAWIGAYGMSILTLLVASLPASMLLESGRRRWRGPALALVLLGAWWAAGTARLQAGLVPPDTDVALRLVQANVDQHDKWNADRRAYWFERHLEMSVAPSQEPPRLLIWPESAVPYQLEKDPTARAYIAQVIPDDSYALVGGNRYDLEAEPPVAHNSVFVLDAKGTIVDVYDKVDLVPFGEFLPLRPLLSRIGLEKLTAGSLDFVPGPGRRAVRLDGLPAFSPLICYEAIFPGRSIDPHRRPAWLLNITNDAWFGNSSGPYQHLAMARMRSVEEGLPLVRAANSGISVVTDALGQVRHELPLQTAGVIDARLPAALPDSTMYRSLGGLIVSAIVGVLGVSAFLVERRARPGRSA